MLWSNYPSSQSNRDCICHSCTRACTQLHPSPHTGSHDPTQAAMTLHSLAPALPQLCPSLAPALPQPCRSLSPACNNYSTQPVTMIPPSLAPSQATMTLPSLIAVTGNDESTRPCPSLQPLRQTQPTVREPWLWHPVRPVVRVRVKISCKDRTLRAIFLPALCVPLRPVSYDAAGANLPPISLYSWWKSCPNAAFRVPSLPYCAKACS